MKQIRNAIIGASMFLSGVLFSVAEVGYGVNTYWGYIWTLIMNSMGNGNFLLSFPTLGLMIAGLIIAFWKTSDK